MTSRRPLVTLFSILVLVSLACTGSERSRLQPPSAVSVAASVDGAGLGTVVVFGGEIHHARCARKTDTTSLVAFSSPQVGPLGRVTEGHPTIWSRIPDCK